MDIVNDNYLQIRTEVDQRVAELTEQHAHYLNCRKGCDLCCFSFRVFPVEYDAIAKEAGLTGVADLSATIGENERCAFLANGACTIYESRPLICRTHGLPLLNMTEDGDEWELSFCELNFTDADDDEFAEENVYLQDKYNAMLYQANKEYLEANPQLGYQPDDLLALKDLKKQG